jgi:hypothetical protein
MHNRRLCLVLDTLATLRTELADARFALRAGSGRAWRELSEEDKCRVERAEEAAKERQQPPIEEPLSDVSVDELIGGNS